MIYRNSIIVTICFLAIAFAVVSTTLIVRGSISIGVNENDFNVYFSDVKVNGVQDLSVVVNERELAFITTLKSKDETYVLDYDVTNGSKNYDAKLEMTCTGGNDYLSVNNVFDTNNNLLASETRSGSLTVKLNKQYTGEKTEVNLVCKITVTAAERDELETEVALTPVEPLPGKWKYIDLDGSNNLTEGDLVTLNSDSEEKFNVVSVNGATVTLLAKYNIDGNYDQVKDEYDVLFADEYGWEYTPGPKEIDIQYYGGILKIYVNDYVNYLKTKTGDLNISGDLITMNQLKSLGCTINDDYSYTNNLTCANSNYSSWLVNGQAWWTRSADSNSRYWVWVVSGDGLLANDDFDNHHGVRPIITVSKTLLEKADIYSADSFCQNLEYYNGVMNNGTFVPQWEFGQTAIGNLTDAIYLCSDSGFSNPNYVYGYDLDGNIVYDYSTDRPLD